MFEVNLVPEVKRELLRAHSLRKAVTSISILAVAIGVGVVLILGAVVGTQQVLSANRNTEMQSEYDKFMQSSNINASLTIQNQLDQLQKVYDGKKEVSRIFSVLDVILPANEERVTLSDMDISFVNNSILVEGQAQSASLNDYKALQAFEAIVQRTTFDYGRYYDKNGNVIPTIDITEVVEGGSVYGVYTPTACTNEKQEDGTTQEVCKPGESVKIKRYATDEQRQKQDGYYFESACGAYEVVAANGAKRVQSSCNLSTDGLQVTDRTSGRNTTSNDVVLRFDGKLTIDERVFEFNNKHMYIIGPERQNVTDSYDQIRDMFEEKASDCASDDAQCIKEGSNYGN
jgi:hypothetical protein